MGTRRGTHFEALGKTCREGPVLLPPCALASRNVPKGQRVRMEVSRKRLRFRESRDKYNVFYPRWGLSRCFLAGSGEGGSGTTPTLISQRFTTFISHPLLSARPTRFSHYQFLLVSSE